MLYERTRFQVVGYGLFAALEVLVLLVFLCYALDLRGYPLPAALWAVVPLLVAVTVVASAAINVLRRWRDAATWTLLLARPGLNVHGGMIGAAVAGSVVSVYADIDVFAVLDAMAWGFLAGHALGRIGCFNYGCCYGRPTGSPFGIAYSDLRSRVLRVRPGLAGVPLHPVQLYSAAVNLLGFVLATLLIASNTSAGIAAGAFLVYHGVARTLLERFRYDTYESGGRNRVAFRFALVTIACGVAILGERVAHAGLFSAAPLSHAVSPKTFARFLAGNHERLLPACISGCAFTFAVLGIRPRARLAAGTADVNAGDAPGGP